MVICGEVVVSWWWNVGNYRTPFWGLKIGQDFEVYFWLRSCSLVKTQVPEAGPGAPNSWNLSRNYGIVESLGLATGISNNDISKEQIQGSFTTFRMTT
jgi:hypothetical protein